MGTLGQKLKTNTDARSKASSYSPEQVAAREAERIKAKVDSLTKVVEKAKADIAKAIEAGKDEYRIQSKVPDTNEAYKILSTFRYHQSFLSDREVLEPVWNGFLSWAASEDLRIELVSHLPDMVDGERNGGSYMLIRARPVGSAY